MALPHVALRVPPCEHSVEIRGLGGFLENLSCCFIVFYVLNPRLRHPLKRGKFLRVPCGQIDYGTLDRERQNLS